MLTAIHALAIAFYVLAPLIHIVGFAGVVAIWIVAWAGIGALITVAAARDVLRAIAEGY